MAARQEDGSPPRSSASIDARIIQMKVLGLRWLAFDRPRRSLTCKRNKNDPLPRKMKKKKKKMTAIRGIVAQSLPTRFGPATTIINVARELCEYTCKQHGTRTLHGNTGLQKRRAHDTTRAHILRRTHAHAASDSPPSCSSSMYVQSSINYCYGTFIQSRRVQQAVRMKVKAFASPLEKVESLTAERSGARAGDQ